MKGFVKSTERLIDPIELRKARSPKRENFFIRIFLDEETPCNEIVAKELRLDSKSVMKTLKVFVSILAKGHKGRKVLLRALGERGGHLRLEKIEKE